MLCLWQGHIASVSWPRHDPAVVDLPLELWSSQVDSQLQSAHTRLEFNKFVYLGDVPLWTIAGPEVQVFTQDGPSIQFFSELAAIKTATGERVAVRVSIPSHEANNDVQPPDYLLLYAVQDESDPSARIAARPLILNPKLVSPLTSPKPPPTDKPRPLQVARTAGEQSAPRQPQVDTGVSTQQPRIKKQGISDVKKAIQQTILGALRLRGIRRDNPDFKNMYHIISRATELALRNHSKDEIDVNDVHEKVEALLAIIE